MSREILTTNNDGGRNDDDDDDDAVLLQPFNISRRPPRFTRRTARRFKSPRFAMSRRRRDDFAVAGSRLARRRHRRDARGRVFFAQRFSRAGCEQGRGGFFAPIGCFFRARSSLKRCDERERSDLCFLFVFFFFFFFFFFAVGERARARLSIDGFFSR